MDNKKIKVFIVDDQRVVRGVIKKMLSTDPDIIVVGEASNPFEASELIPDLDPDVLTLDVEMPRMNGVEFLQKLMPQYPIPVIMFSSTTEEGSEKAFLAMRYGAIDFVTKPDGGANSLENTQTELIQKIKNASTVNMEKWLRKIKLRPQDSNARKLGSQETTKHNLIAIGASTGGVTAIRQILSDIPNDFPCIVITQHMPPGFTSTFAKGVAKDFGLDVREAQNQDLIQRGRIYIAPGDFHLVVNKRNGVSHTVGLTKADKVNGHRPSVDVLFSSIVENKLAQETIGIILTGMGMDGAKGMLALREAGAKTIGESEQSALIYGMPKVAYDIGGVEEQLNLSQMVPRLKHYLNYSSSYA
ncbi:MAG: chemotaxis response regulator protein-glutamate methylesterase [Leptospiraceae bacterium]|nr:chemotaxis response regulator protein-glutamate methylesterase [Leptospiraceae bacterium]